MRGGIVAGAAVCVALGAPGGAVARSSSVKPMPLCVKREAVALAAERGEDHPRRIEAVRTTANRADALDQEHLPPSEGPPISFVSMRGRFWPSSWDPFGATHGDPEHPFTWAVVPMNAPDCAHDGYGLRADRPHIGRLGRVHRLSR